MSRHLLSTRLSRIAATAKVMPSLSANLSSPSVGTVRPAARFRTHRAESDGRFAGIVQTDAHSGVFAGNHPSAPPLPSQSA